MAIPSKWCAQMKALFGCFDPCLNPDVLICAASGKARTSFWFMMYDVLSETLVLQVDVDQSQLNVFTFYSVLSA